MPNGSPTIPDDMPKFPVYEGCSYHGTADGMPQTICSPTSLVSAGTAVARARKKRASSPS
jgi:hypothetical protein